MIPNQLWAGIFRLYLEIKKLLVSSVGNCTWEIVKGEA
jgi:hypothetical protein